jgi:hypothetical protein
MGRLFLMVLLASGVVFGYGSALGLVDVGSHHRTCAREATPPAP